MDISGTAPGEIPLISVIILNYNGLKQLGETLRNCLRSVLKSDYPNFEVLFVDNGSNDRSVRFVKENFGQDARVRIVENRENLGYAEGSNRGIKESKGQFGVILNNDTLVEAGWLTALAKAAEQPSVGAVQSKLVRMDNPDILDCAGGLLDYYGYQLERGRGEKAANYNKSSNIFYAKGACVLLKREVLNRTGFFDSDIFLYFDEVDLCWRIWLSGYRVVYAPASVVHHASGSTASALQQQVRQFFFARNHVLILLKNYDLANMFRSLAVTILFETRNVLLLVARRKPLVVVSILKGLLWNIVNLRQTWRKRQQVQKNVRRVPDETVKAQMLRPYPPFPLYIIFHRTRYRTRS